VHDTERRTVVAIKIIIQSFFFFLADTDMSRYHVRRREQPKYEMVALNTIIIQIGVADRYSSSADEIRVFDPFSISRSS
jgi:hypothetical protein